MHPGTIGTAMGMWLIFFSAVHDHMHSRGERKTTFFKWTGTNYSPLLHFAELIRKGDAKPKAKQKR
jgi:hypothetical protein